MRAGEVCGTGRDVGSQSQWHHSRHQQASWRTKCRDCWHSFRADSHRHSTAEVRRAPGPAASRGIDPRADLETCRI